ncbi:MAG: hypothetical protein ABW048_13680 [Sphingobium sp.]
MTELSSRNMPVLPVASTTDRVAATPRIAPVERVAAQTQTRPDAQAVPTAAALRAASQGASPADTPSLVQPGEEQARSHADYAEVQEKIASILSGLDNRGAQGSGAAVADADKAMAQLMPQPSVVLPLPPTSDAMVAFINQVRQSIVTQSALARAAMSSVSPATVEAAVA